MFSRSLLSYSQGRPVMPVAVARQVASFWKVVALEPRPRPGRGGRGGGGEEGEGEEQM